MFLRCTNRKKDGKERRYWNLNVKGTFMSMVLARWQTDDELSGTHAKGLDHPEHGQQFPMWLHIISTKQHVKSFWRS
jgi:hypothetical protein